MSTHAAKAPRRPRPVMPEDVHVLARQMAGQVRTLADRSGARETVVTSALMLLANELLGERVATHVLLATRLGDVV